MVQCEAPESITKTEADASATKLDLARYRTSELAGRLVELISVPHAFGRIALVTICIAAAAWLTVTIVFQQAELSGLGWLGLSAYALVIGFVLGVALGFLRVLSRALANIEELLKLMLNITENAANDYTELLDGTTRMPSAGELVEHVYDAVVMPTLDKAVLKAFGFVGQPVLWLYRRSVGAAVHYVIKKMARSAMTDDQAATAVEAAKSYVGTWAAYPEYIRDYTRQAADYVHLVSRRIRFYATLPLYVGFFVSLIVAAAPVVALRFFMTGCMS